MSYRRVIPRDLFNEANLLKCLGQMELNLEKYGKSLEHHNPEGAFEVYQDPADGAIYCNNVRFKNCWLYRPLNSREPYPLYWDYIDGVPVFNDDGTFTEEFIKVAEL